jgi:hypothetical protein
VHALHAKIYLLVDEKLRKSQTEQVIYSFVPLTNASEVELLYVRDFINSDAASAFAAKLGEKDHGIYLGTERWPRDTFLNARANSREWFAMLGKISFLVEKDAPDYVQMPKGLFPRVLLWKKYAELTRARYAGYFNTHSLDVRPITPKIGKWGRVTCVHESGKPVPAGGWSPVSASGNELTLNFRYRRQQPYIGRLICVNGPGGDSIAEINVVHTDVAMQTDAGRFSVWNEARPLAIYIESNRQITAPLSLQIVPEINETRTEFFFQGDRILCYEKRCKKRDATFLLPAFRDLKNTFEIAIRATGDSYFRGNVILKAGDIEVASAPVRFTPHSWVSEAGYALRNPSEYKSAFLWYLLFSILVVGALALLVYAAGRWRKSLIARRKPALPRQTSAEVNVEPEVYYRITASKNPFGCELVDFGSIVGLRIDRETVSVEYGGSVREFPLLGFAMQLPDGYVLTLRIITGAILLQAYCLNGKGSSEKAVKF